MKFLASPMAQYILLMYMPADTIPYTPNVFFPG